MNNIALPELPKLDVSNVPGDHISNIAHLALNFLSTEIRNPNTRRAYFAAIRGFSVSLQSQGIVSAQLARPIHVARWVELMSRRYAPTTVKQRLAAVNMFLDWLVRHQVIAINPGASVKGPRYSQGKGKTPVLDAQEARQLIQAIPVDSAIGLRDRALIGVMLYSFARIGAVLKLKTSDVFVQSRRLWLRLQEKGGKLHDMPCHHELEEWLEEYLSVTGIPRDSDHPLFPSVDRSTGELGRNPLAHANAYQMVRRRAVRAGIKTAICNHTFRATGITAFLMNNGTLEMAARLANHSSTRTTQLYDRRNDAITLSEIERIRF